MELSIMKKFLLFAAACVALVACKNGTESIQNEPLPVVTISASMDFNQEAQSCIRRITPDDPTASTVNFSWEAGDQVIIKNNSGTSTLTIVNSSISGNKADFTGTALSDMSSYEVYYGYKNGLDAVQDLPYLKDSTFRPFIQGEGNSTGFNLNSFMPVLKINIVGGQIDTAVVDSIIYTIGSDKKAKMSLPTIHVGKKSSFSLYFPVPQTNNSTTNFTLYVYYRSNSPFQAQPYHEHTTSYNLSAHMSEIINFEASIPLFACFAAGTRITMADGSTKAVENIQKGDRVRTFDHEAGQLSEEAVCYVFDNGLEAIPFTLHFASGNTLSIVDKHDLLVESSRKYVVVSQANAQSFVGQRFYNADKAQWDELTEVTFGATPTRFYTIYSANHINCIANGLLTCPDDIDFNLNIYEMDASLKADPVQLAADRAQYGSYTHADFPELTKDLDAFDALNRNTKIALGKGLVTWERLMQIYEDYK